MNWQLYIIVHCNYPFFKAVIVNRVFIRLQVVHCYPWAHRPAGCTLLSVGPQADNLHFVIRRFTGSQAVHCYPSVHRLAYCTFFSVGSQACLLYVFIGVLLLLLQPAAAAAAATVAGVDATADTTATPAVRHDASCCNFV